MEELEQYTFFSANRVMIQTKDGLLKVSAGRGKIEVTCPHCKIEFTRKS